MGTRSNFDKELEILHVNLVEMGKLVESVIEKSVKALAVRDSGLTEEVIAQDKQIDDFERQIETTALRLLLRQQPVARDLRAISVALKIITDMERIGDQASNIADLSLRFSEEMPADMIKQIPLMGAIAMDMVNSSIKSFVNSDFKLAADTILLDDKVDSLFEEVKGSVISLLISHKEKADQAIDIMMIAKYLERIADHAENICEWVQFYETGEHKHIKIL